MKRTKAAECRRCLNQVEQYLSQYGACDRAATDSISTLYAAIRQAADVAQEVALTAPATPKQQNVLVEFGLPTSLTKAEASRVINQIEKNGWKLPTEGRDIVKRIPANVIDRECPRPVADL